MNRELLTAEDLDRAASDLDPAWSIGPDQLRRTVEFHSFLDAVRFIDELAPIAERLNHHPDLRLSWRTVELDLSTHDADGVTAVDVELARELDQIIRSLIG